MLCYVMCVCVCVCVFYRADSHVFVYHSLNDGNLYEHNAESNESSVVMDESIFVRLFASLIDLAVIDRILVLKADMNPFCWPWVWTLNH